MAFMRVPTLALAAPPRFASFFKPWWMAFRQQFNLDGSYSAEQRLIRRAYFTPGTTATAPSRRISLVFTFWASASASRCLGSLSFYVMGLRV